MEITFKKAIENNYKRCVEILDYFDDAQISAIHKFITVLNSSSKTYELWDTVDRVSILHYLVCLKLNESGLDEDTIYYKISAIHTAMSAMALLGLEYNK